MKYRIWKSDGTCVSATAEGPSPEDAFDNRVRQVPTAFPAGKYVVAVADSTFHALHGEFAVIERYKDPNPELLSRVVSL